MKRISLKAVLLGMVVLSLPCGAIAQSASAPAIDAHILPGKIEDKRSTESSAFMNNLEITLKVMGDSVRDAEGITTVAVTKAVDDLGRNLKRDEDKSQKAILFDFTSIQKNQASVDTSIKLDNPSRKATAIQELSGFVQFYVPQKDPKSKVSFPGIMQKTGTWLPLNDDKSGKLRIMAMTKAQYDAAKKDEEQKKETEVAKDKSIPGAMTKAFGDAFKAMFIGFNNMGPNDVAFMIEGEDSQNQVVKIEMFDASGNAVKSNSKSGGRVDNNTERYTFSFQDVVPPDAKMVVSVATPSSVMNVPFALTSVPLP